MNNILYKKQHKIKLSLITNKKWSDVRYGTYAIKAVNSGILTAKQVESFRRVISRVTKRVGRVFIRVFFNLSKTKKPLLSRMGKGCGLIKNWIAVIRKGTVILELNGAPKRISMTALNTASVYLPIRVVVISRCLYLLR